METGVFWDVTSCRLIDRFRRFGAAFYLYLQDVREDVGGLQGVTFQKIDLHWYNHGCRDSRVQNKWTNIHVVSYKDRCGNVGLQEGKQLEEQ